MKRFFRLLSEFSTLGAIIGALPFNIQNGQQEDANPVMANFNSIVSQINNNVPALIPSLGAITPFTPVVLYGGANTGMTFFSQWGWYINFGGFVFFMADVSINAQGSSTGVATIGGLPIAINASLQSGNLFGGLLNCVNVNFVAGSATVPFWAPKGGTTQISLNSMGNNATVTNLSNVNIPSFSRVACQGFYFT